MMNNIGDAIKQFLDKYTVEALFNGNRYIR